MRRSVGAFVLMSAVAAQVGAQVPENIKSHVATLRGQTLQVNTRATTAANCEGGLVYDDGVFENGYTLNAADARMVQRFDPLSVPATLRNVCVCWSRLGADTSLSFNIQVYQVGASGPGALIASVPAVANNVPQGLPGAFYSYDLSSAGITTNGNVYIGVQWNDTVDDNFFLCGDEGAAPARPAYMSVNGGVFWGSALSVIGPLFEAFGIRAEFGADTSACVPSTTQLCLNKGRFAVTAKFQAGSNPEGTSNVVKLTDETGYLWFFNSANVEAVVKVLDACGLNNHFWVFAGGLTDVRVDLTVTDTETTNSKTYTNPQGRPFQPIQDTAALPCN